MDGRAFTINDARDWCQEFEGVREPSCELIPEVSLIESVDIEEAVEAFNLLPVHSSTSAAQLNIKNRPWWCNTGPCAAINLP